MHESTGIGRLIKLAEASRSYSLLRNKDISLILFGPILYKHCKKGREHGNIYDVLGPLVQHR